MFGGDFGSDGRAIHDVRHHHLRALGRERLRIMLADAHRPSGHDRRTPRKPRHVSSVVLYHGKTLVQRGAARQTDKLRGGENAGRKE
jgi:hypothetical protein